MFDSFFKLVIELSKLPVPTVLILVGMGLLILAVLDFEKPVIKNRWVVGLLGLMALGAGLMLYVPVVLQPVLAVVEPVIPPAPTTSARPVGVAVGGATNAAPAVNPTPRPLWVAHDSTGVGVIVDYTMDLEAGGFVVGETWGLNGDYTGCFVFYAAGPGGVNFTLDSAAWNRYENVLTVDQQNELIEERRNYLEQHHPSCKYRVATVIALTP